MEKMITMDYEEYKKLNSIAFHFKNLEKKINVELIRQESPKFSPTPETKRVAYANMDDIKSFLRIVLDVDSIITCPEEDIYD